MAVVKCSRPIMIFSAFVTNDASCKHAWFHGGFMKYYYSDICIRPVAHSVCGILSICLIRVKSLFCKCHEVMN